MALTNPVTLGMKTKNGFPQFTYENGITLSYEFFAANSFTPDYLIGIGWLSGAQHWISSGIYSKVRLASFQVEPLSLNDLHSVVKCNFKFDYPNTMNEFGEIWEYSFASEQTEIKSVTKANLQKSYTSLYATGTENELAIGVDGETVNGTSVYRPSISMKIMKVFGTKPSDSFIRGLLAAICKVNNAKFDLWESKEVLFLGFNLQKNNDGYWQIDYDFKIAEKQVDEAIVLSDLTSVTPSIDPWDYVWYKYVSNPGEEMIETGIESVHVAKTYSSTSFTVLGLGV